MVVCWPILNICNCLQRLFNNACYRLAENCTWICTFIFISHRIFREVCVKGISRNYEKQYILRNYNYKLSHNSNLNENKDNNVKKIFEILKGEHLKLFRNSQNLTNTHTDCEHGMLNNKIVLNSRRPRTCNLSMKNKQNPFCQILSNSSLPKDVQMGVIDPLIMADFPYISGLTIFHICVGDY